MRTSAHHSPQYLLLLTLLVLVVTVSGCSGLLSLLELAGAIGTVYAIFHNSGSGTPTWDFPGYVFVNSTTNTVVIQSTNQALAGYQTFSGAKLILTTNPPSQQTTSSLGYFDFTGIPTTTSTLLLTVTIPNAQPVQFNVVLNTSSGLVTITPTS
jgi:hypothetical protein